MLRYDRQIKPGLVAFLTSGQEMERVYSYNPGACMEQFMPQMTQVVMQHLSHVCIIYQINSTVINTLFNSL